MDVNMISSTNTNSEDESNLRRGPWTVEEDLTLINYIATHGEGRWNSLARCAGLKRTGKSCRLRWLNYLRPDVRRGNITLEEQLMILELHSRWGNRWSKIAQYLPGRTDNEIKNYWRTRVQKHAKQLKCDVNSKQFKDTMRYLWMPRLVERIQAANGVHPIATATATTATSSGGSTTTTTTMGYSDNNLIHASVNSNFAPENSANSSSDLSDLGDYYGIPINNQDYFQCDQVNYGGENSLTSPNCGFMNNQAMDYQGLDNNNHNNNNNYMEQSNQQQWAYGVGVTTDNLWNIDDIFMLQQQFNY